MPHPERTTAGDPYFLSVRRWLDSGKKLKPTTTVKALGSVRVPDRSAHPVEIFIDTVITNNEERTVEQAARRLAPSLRLKQYRYTGLMTDRTTELLSSLTFFNPNKEIAYVRKNNALFAWDSGEKRLRETTKSVLVGVTLLRRDEPDTAGEALGKGCQTGVCYDCRVVSAEKLLREDVCEVFCNPHSSLLERML